LKSTGPSILEGEFSDWHRKHKGKSKKIQTNFKMGNALKKSSEYKEMKRQVKRNTVINCNIPTVVDDARLEGTGNKNVTFHPSISVLHFDMEDGKNFGDIVTEDVFDAFDSDEQAPNAQSSSFGNGGTGSFRQQYPALQTVDYDDDDMPSPTDSFDSPSSPPAKVLRPKDSILVARLKKSSVLGSEQGSPLQRSPMPGSPLSSSRPAGSPLGTRPSGSILLQGSR
jgi:hypothetical protein